MKAYKRMRDGENLSWCRPYRCGDNYYARNESGVVGLMQNGVDLVIDKDTLRIVDECDDWKEIGCAECPWRDECEAMEEDVDDFSDEDLAKVAREAYEWTDPDCNEAMEALAGRAGSVLRELYRSGMADDMDCAMTATEDILSWIRVNRDDDEDWDWDEKVWEASKLLEGLAKLPCPYKSSDMDDSVYDGWESIAGYIQMLLDVDLGV